MDSDAVFDVFEVESFAAGAFGPGEGVGEPAVGGQRKRNVPSALADFGVQALVAMRDGEFLDGLVTL